MKGTQLKNKILMKNKDEKILDEKIPRRLNFSEFNDDGRRDDRDHLLNHKCNNYSDCSCCFDPNS